MKAEAFSYARAASVAEALALWRGAGPDARLVAGGQSLVAGLNLRLGATDALVDVSRIDGLRGVEEHPDRLVIGALTRHADLARDPLVALHAPAFAEAAPLIAHAAIRNRGTLGGSLAYADPAAELPACALALDAVVVAESEAGRRRIPAAAFFVGLFETALQPFEMLVAVEVPKCGPTRRHKVIELARRSGDYAMAGLALAADVEGGRLRDVRVAGFALGVTPVLAAAAAAALEAGADRETVEAALDRDLDPSDDLQASAAMKRHLAKVLLRRAVAALLDPTADVRGTRP